MTTRSGKNLKRRADTASRDARDVHSSRLSDSAER